MSKNLQEIYTSNKPIYLDLSPHRWMSTRIMIDRQIIGQVNMIEFNRPFKKRDEEILQYVSVVISHIINNNSKNYESFIIDLLEGNLINRKVIKERAKSIGYTLMGNFRVIVVQTTLESGKHRSFLHLDEILGNIIYDSKTVRYQDKIVLIINLRV